MRTRVVTPEMMDDPALSPGAHVHALRGLARLNWWSGAARHIWRPVRSLAEEAGDGARIRVLDLACGGGDVAIGLWRRAQREGLAIEVAGCDVSSRAVEHASLQAAREGAEVRFFERDVVRDALPAEYDVLTCSLFLHHLPAGELVPFLKSAARAARRVVVVCDLRRSWRGLALAQVATRALTRSPVVHVDGPRSARAALSMEEVAHLAASAGMREAEIRPCWPQRFVLVWRKQA